MRKTTRGGRTAVLVSSGFGAGWSTWNTGKKELLYDPEVVEYVGAGKPFGQAGLQKLMDDKYGEEYVCVLGWKGLYIEWVAEGQIFAIDEYDGRETIRFGNHTQWETG